MCVFLPHGPGPCPRALKLRCTWPRPYVWQCLRGKFKPSLEPLLGEVALKAITLGEYDDNKFVDVMPRLFTYNMCASSLSICDVRLLTHTRAETNQAHDLA